MREHKGPPAKYCPKKLPEEKDTTTPADYSPPAPPPLRRQTQLTYAQELEARRQIEERNREMR